MTVALFEHPEWIAAILVCVAVLAIALAASQWLARRRIRALLGAGAVPSEGSIRTDLLLWSAIAFVGVALLGPRIGERTVLVSTRGADVVFLFDVSRSMDARDVAPSRLLRARSTADELLLRLEPEDRAALAAFSSRGVLLTPLTPDTAALRDMLTALDTDLIRPAASDLETGVDAALGAFDEASDRPRVIVLLSDGEAADRDTNAAAAQAVRRNVRILAIPLGSDTGATIPDSAGGELRDGTGHVVVTRRRVEPLSNLAERTGGATLRTNEWGEIDGEAAAALIGRDARGLAGEFIERRVKAPLVLPFAAIALALLFVEALPAGAAKRLRWRAMLPGQPAAAATALILVLLVPRPGPADGEAENASGATAAIERLEAQARRRALSAREHVELGLARAHADRWSDAENSFFAAALLARDPALAAVAYHDLGVIALRNDELERARDLFFDSLALRPKNAETQFNLEWAIAALSVQEPDPEPPDDADEPALPDPKEDPREPAEPKASEPDLPQTSSPSDEQAEAAEARPQPLSEAQRERWYERIEDDPSRALGSAVRPQGDGERVPRKRNAPAW